MAITVATRQLTGFDLKAERVRVGLRAADVARLLEVSRPRITAIESLHRVRPELAKRYLDALGSKDPSTHQLVAPPTKDARRRADARDGERGTRR